MPIGKILGGYKVVQTLFGKKDKPSQNELNVIADIRQVQPERGRIEALDSMGGWPPKLVEVDGQPFVVPFQFNPPEYTKEVGIQLNEVIIPGSMTPFLEFIGGKKTSVTFEIMFFAPMGLHLPGGEELASLPDSRGVTGTAYGGYIPEKFQKSQGYVQYKVNSLLRIFDQKNRFTPPPLIRIVFPQGASVSNDDRIDAARKGLTAAEVSAGIASINAGTNTEGARYKSGQGFGVMGMVEKMKVTYKKFDAFMRPLQATVEVTVVQAQPARKRVKKAEPPKKLPKKPGMPVAKTCPPFPAVRMTVLTLQKAYRVNTWNDLCQVANKGKTAGNADYIRLACILKRNNVTPTTQRDSIIETMQAKNEQRQSVATAAIAAEAIAKFLSPLVMLGSIWGFSETAAAARDKLSKVGVNDLVVVPTSGGFSGAKDVMSAAPTTPETITGVEPPKMVRDVQVIQSIDTSMAAEYPFGNPL